MRALGTVFLGLLVLVPVSASAGEPGAAFRADVPWAKHPGDSLDETPFEQTYGIAEDALPDVEPYWDGTLLYTKGSASRYSLEQQGLEPQHAVAYDPSPGVLYIAMQGITLTPTCTGGDLANSAKRCSPLVEQETTFPAYGNAAQQTAMFNALSEYYEPFDIVMTTSEPPEWMPYTMAVIGGTAGLVGQDPGTCGVANVACDGLKRNHVSLTFPGSCGGVAEIAAQETAHNWGLEHTDDTTDLLYPYNNGGFKTFRDDCMEISHATGSGVTQCGYVHEDYCPAGGGEQQNTYQELVAVFGPRTPDDIVPEITSVSPHDGSTFTTDDTIKVTATVSENSNFLAAKWSLSGADTELSRCSNNVCDQDYNVGVGFDPNEVEWDFVTLTQPPAGTYTLMFEVLDAYGNYDSETLQITVTQAEGGSDGPTSDSEAGSSSGDGGGTDAGDETGVATGEPTTGDDDGEPPGGTDTEAPGADEDGDDGCGCTQRQSPTHGFLALFLLGLTVRRRRRAR